MPTKHRRIAVVEDPELEEALARASERYPGSSSAGLVRRLAILGAETLKESETPSTKLERLLARPGVRPPVSGGGIRAYLANRPELRNYDPEDPYPGTRALREQREDKI